ncbi:MAG: DUF896 domain-containing protein [Oscillospiraceae bacterium]|jgi:uncharacterized protein YnzC (UPF0291/DUF896 family)|nr:DUF896 domain-containing protein [Oscillospiraceae bacterium]
MEHEQILRINELARKSRTLGLTEEERGEQQRLRAQYLREFRAGFEETLRRVRVEQEDGSYAPLQKQAAPGDLSEDRLM